MSLILIDSFAFDSGGENKEFDLYLDNETGIVTADFVGEGIEPTTVNAIQRGRQLGDLVGNFTSEDESEIYVILASLNTPFTYLSETIPNTPEPDACDISFEFVNTTNETQQSANDGAISALAISSFDSIEYSIDNGTTWQSSGDFTNLSPGNYTLSATDSNGCIINFDIVIQSFANPLIKSPVEVVSYGNVSKWLAAYNPIVFEFLNKVTLIPSSNSIVAIYPGVNNIGIGVQVNFAFSELDKLEIAKYNQVVANSSYSFTAKSDFIRSSGNQTIFNYKDVTYIGFSGSGGSITTYKGKQNYRLEIEITTETGTIIGSWYPNLNNITRADISAYLQTLVNARDDFKYNVINWKDPNRSASFQVRYREVWDGGASDWYNFQYPLYVTYSAKQLGDQYGGNMAKYVPFYKENNANKKAEFLTEFVEPTLNVGLPFDLSFIYSESIIGTPIKMRITSLDINKNNILGGVINSFLLNSDIGYLVANPSTKLIISNGVLPPVENEEIIEALGINRLMIPGEPSQNTEYFQVQLYRGDDETPYFITKPLILKVNNPCSNDPYIYLKWINKLGGWDYFRFGFNQEYKINTSNDTVVKRNIFDYKTDTAAIDIVKKIANKSITFGASGISKDQSIGLEGLAESINVMMLVNENPYQWLTVELNTGSFNVYETRGNLFDVKFSLSLPDINIQRQ